MDKPRFPIFGIKYAIVFSKDGTVAVFRSQDWPMYNPKDGDEIQYISFVVANLICRAENSK